MLVYIIDRFEGEYAVLEEESGAHKDVHRAILPKNAAEGDFLRRQYEDIIPGYYMNKVHWNSVKAEGNVPDALLREMLEKSYRLVLGGFSKKKLRALLEGEKKDAI